MSMCVHLKAHAERASVFWQHLHGLATCLLQWLVQWPVTAVAMATTAAVHIVQTYKLCLHHSVTGAFLQSDVTTNIPQATNEPRWQLSTLLTCLLCVVHTANVEGCYGPVWPEQSRSIPEGEGTHTILYSVGAGVSVVMLLHHNCFDVSKHCSGFVCFIRPFSWTWVSHLSAIETVCSHWCFSVSVWSVWCVCVRVCMRACMCSIQWNAAMWTLLKCGHLHNVDIICLSQQLLFYWWR